MFENERYQPFRGWGHQWPGHFLPTDRVGHWSTQTSAQQANLDSASFDAIAPKLKQVRGSSDLSEKAKHVSVPVQKLLCSH